jgi:antirestriction protein ArdC
MPPAKSPCPLRHNGIPYKGINVVMLWSASVVKGYACPLWLTFKQALELGGHVKKGETGELVVDADRITRTGTGDKGEESEREIPFPKGYTVFNAGQCEVLPGHYTAKAEPPALTPAQRIEAAARFFAATGADIRHGGTRAFYAEGSGYMQIPPLETVREAESHAAILALELTRWTKHDERLTTFLREDFKVEKRRAKPANASLIAGRTDANLCALRMISRHDDKTGYDGQNHKGDWSATLVSFPSGAGTRVVSRVRDFHSSRM